MNNLTNISLYDLMAEDIDVWIKPNKAHGFDVDLDNGFDNEFLREKGVHPDAMESFASFCRSFLASYENTLKKKAV